MNTHAPDDQPQPAVLLRVMATSDLHAQIMAYDYAHDRPTDAAGLARTASLIRAARAEAPGALLFDNGDFLEGGPLAAPGDGIAPHPVIAAMNQVGFDAVGLGNHDLGYGLETLGLILKDATFPVLATNLVRRGARETDADSHPFPPFLMLHRTVYDRAGRQHDLGIGILSLMPPQAARWEADHLDPRIAVREMVDTAAHWVPRLRALGADLVIGLCHSGIGGAHPEAEMENALIPLAGIDGLDVLIGGHTHLVFPGDAAPDRPEVDRRAGAVCGKPLVMPGSRGSHLGVIDLTLAQGPAGWRVAAFRCEARPIARRSRDGLLRPTVVDDAAVTGSVRRDHDRALTLMREQIGDVAAAITTYTARLADCSALGLLHDAQLDWLRTCLRGTAWENLPPLSAASLFKGGGRGGPENFTEIAKGPLTRRHVMDLYPFQNEIRAIEITGRQLRLWLERSAATYGRLKPGRMDQPLFCADDAAYNCDTVLGVTYEIDLTHPPLVDGSGVLLPGGPGRIRLLRHGGHPVRDDDRFAMATNSYRLSGGGGFPRVADGAVLFAPGLSQSDLLTDYIRRQGTIAPRPSQNWRLAAQAPGTGGWFDTSPRLAAQPGFCRRMGITPGHITDEGFLRCTFHLPARAQDSLQSAASLTK